MPTTYTDKFQAGQIAPTWTQLPLAWSNYNQTWGELGTTVYVDKYKSS
jgi:hypothetical protein